jgi:hypothetical protein
MASEYRRHTDLFWASKSKWIFISVVMGIGERERLPFNNNLYSAVS